MIPHQKIWKKIEWVYGEQVLISSKVLLDREGSGRGRLLMYRYC